MKVFISKCDREFEIDETRVFPGIEADVVAAVIAIIHKCPTALWAWEGGFRHGLNDSLSGFSENPKPGTRSVKTSKTEMSKMIQDRLDNLYEGRLRMNGVGDATIEMVAYKISRDIVWKRWAAHNPDKKGADYKAWHDDAVRELDANPKIMKIAAAQFELNAELRELV
jgi:hypothetical protein